MRANVDPATVRGFGEEWRKFDQSALPDDERATIWRQYFAIFPWDELPDEAVGFDLGCGSGRWATLVAPRVAELHCVDASPEALRVARGALDGSDNCVFHVAGVDALPFADGSMDFGYSLGVLHHVPDTQAALSAAVRPLKPGAPLLVYLYYAFDNRPRLVPGAVAGHGPRAPRRVAKPVGSQVGHHGGDRRDRLPAAGPPRAAGRARRA